MPGQASRLRNTRLDPRPVRRLHPVRARARHDPQTAIAPELPPRPEAVRRHDDRHEPCGADRPEARRRLQDADDPVLLGFVNELRLRLLLLIQQEVEVRVEPCRPRLAGDQYPQLREVRGRGGPGHADCAGRAGAHET